MSTPPVLYVYVATRLAGVLYTLIAANEPSITKFALVSYATETALVILPNVTVERSRTVLPLTSAKFNGVARK